MKIIDQSWHWLQQPTNPLELIERTGRICYKSENRINPGSAAKFVKMLVELGHEAVIEHVQASVLLITNRGVTHELVRHRMASYAQESTRYVKYHGEMEFIKPVWWDDVNYSQQQKDHWSNSMQIAENSYHQALEFGDKPEQARELLPNSLKTEIAITANLREWRHIFKLRCSNKAHPQIRMLMLDCMKGFAQAIPVVFDDLLIQLQK